MNMNYSGAYCTGHVTAILIAPVLTLFDSCHTIHCPTPPSYRILLRLYCFALDSMKVFVDLAFAKAARRL